MQDAYLYALHLCGADYLGIARCMASLGYPRSPEQVGRDNPRFALARWCQAGVPCGSIRVSRPVRCA